MNSAGLTEGDVLTGMSTVHHQYPKYNPEEAMGRAGKTARVRYGVLLASVFFVLTIIVGCDPSPVPFTGKVFYPGQEQAGHWQTLHPDDITEIYGVGLSYAEHIAETGGDWEPDSPPPVFRKSLGALNRNGVVPYPTRQDFLNMAEKVEPGLGKILEARFSEIVPLIDYEVELGVVLLEPYDRNRGVDGAYLPRLGFVLSGDFTSRTFMILGEEQDNRYVYWGAAKSFPGFAVVGERMWVPEKLPPDGLLEVALETTVNGVVRQQAVSDDNVYSIRDILAFVAAAFPDAALGTGTVIMTGTPSGVAFEVPAWKRTLADFFGINRLTLMKTAMETYRDDPDFLQVGDVVVHSAGPFGSLTFRVE